MASVPPYVVIHDPQTKRPFDIDETMQRIEETVRPYRKAALFELYDQGYKSTFEVLIACMISVRTYDEVTVPTAKKLFAQARSPAQVVRMSIKTIDRLIANCTFHQAKAQNIQTIAGRVVREFGGEVPCKHDVLISFPGVGPKCANLVLGIACGQPFIGVDIHVHRVTNRWGYVQAATPEKTLEQLQKKLPVKYSLEINRLLVPFGKHVCTGLRPKCSTCPVRDMCRQVGVRDPR